VVSEIKDSLEIVHTVEYDNFLKFYFPAFKQLLKEIPPQRVNSPENKLRKNILDILNRLPHNEVLRPLCTELLELVMEVLVVENEDNAILWCAPCLAPYRLDRARARACHASANAPRAPVLDRGHGAAGCRYAPKAETTHT
jgi:hypothetical protein